MRFLFSLFFLSMTLCLFSQSRVDTVSFGSNWNYEIRTFDDDNILRLNCRYFADSINLERETINNYDGSLFRDIYFGPKDMRTVSELNPVTKRIEISEYSVTGKLYEWYETVTDSFDSGYISYYENGQKESEGFQRMLLVYKVDSIDSIHVYGQPELKGYYGDGRTKIGLWHYYYPSGKDSVIGNYSYEVYGYSYEIPLGKEEPGTIYSVATILVETDGVKTGTWNYYSPEGKLIYTEEWNKGNLLKRKTF